MAAWDGRLIANNNNSGEFGAKSYSEMWRRQYRIVVIKSFAISLPSQLFLDRTLFYSQGRP